MHADRTNRVVLTIVGLIALVLGVAGLLAGTGVFGSTIKAQHLTDNDVSRYFSDHGDWLWPAIAGVAFVIVILSLIWLFRLLFSTDRAGDISVAATVPPGGDADSGAAGRTTLRTSALTKAVAAEIESYHGVAAARARVLGAAAEPTLALDVTAVRRADLSGLVQRIENEALSHARAALERDDLRVKLDIAVTEKGVTRTS
jgi:hypothetical protein